MKIGFLHAKITWTNCHMKLQFLHEYYSYVVYEEYVTIFGKSSWEFYKILKLENKWQVYWFTREKALGKASDLLKEKS